MHDDLRRHALAGITWWLLALVGIGALGVASSTAVALLELGWPPGVAGGWRVVAVAAGAGALGTVVLLVLGERRAARRAWPRREVGAAVDLVGVAEGPAIARGTPVPRVWRLDSAAPNVACLPMPSGRHVVVSTAAERGLAADELEAVVALQLGLLLDRGAATVRRALVASASMIGWSIVLGVVVAVVVFAREPVWAGFTFNLALAVSIVTIGLIVLVRRRLRWSWGIMADAVALETTRHPEALVRALRRLAGHNAGRVPVSAGFGTAEPFWVVSVRRGVTVETMVVNGKARRRSSSQMVDDAALLLRAHLVEMVCVGGEPATFGSWQVARETFRRLSVAAGDTPAAATTDAAVAGVRVTPAGATTGALSPVSGEWRSAHAEPPPAVSPLRRPCVPTSADLDAYDRALAGTRTDDGGASAADGDPPSWPPPRPRR